MKSHYSSYIKMPFGIKKIDDLFYNSSIDYNFNDSLKKKIHLFQHYTIIPMIILFTWIVLSIRL